MPKKLVFVKEVTEKVSEADIQKEFEKNLNVVEENLQYVSSFVRIGNGIIDTLAVDEDLRPVLIEFKKPDASEQDAVIQVLDYYTWCVENLDWLDGFIRKTKPNLLKEEEKLLGEVRVMVIAESFDERITRVVSAMEPEVKLVQYGLFEKSPEEIGLSYNIVVDTSIAPQPPPEVKTIDDHFVGKQKMRDIYNTLVDKIKSVDTEIGPKPAKYSITFKHKVNFLYLGVRREKIRLDLLGVGSEPSSERIRLYSAPWAVKGKWGYVEISKVEEIDEELMNWIKHAYDRAA